MSFINFSAVWPGGYTGERPGPPARQGLMRWSSLRTSEPGSQRTVDRNQVNGEPPAELEGKPSDLPELLAGILEDAVQQGATDIHIDTWGLRGALRFRIDGVIHEREPLDLEQAGRLLNQLKISANLDFEATTRPQEGQFRWTDKGRVRDVRVTLIPEAPNNEAAHLRLLTVPEDWKHPEHLGFRAEQLATVRQVMQWPHGLVLVGGPTGSGKTTTLYALTDLEDLRGQIAVAIEDPIEFDLPYVRQLQVDEKRGITMTEGLRTLLRMDADVLMVGEIRDTESAIVAAQAALAGRLVLATIHARDAAGAVSTMRYLGVPSYALASSMRMVLAQNLVRKLCDYCARERLPEDSERKLFESAQLPVPANMRVERGCDRCGRSGFRGRTGVFELAVFDEARTAWLAEGMDEHVLRQRLRDEGVQSLGVEVLQRVSAGVTSLREAARVVGLEWSPSRSE